jgi:hypothetical protein
MIDFMLEVSPILSDKIYELLELGAVRRELVKIPKEIRGIGKTASLVKLAKKYNLTLVVPHEFFAKRLREEHYYPKIYSQHNLDKLRGISDVKIIFDEGVDINNLEGFEVVTGIVYS